MAAYVSSSTNRGEQAHIVFKELVNFARRECPEMAVGAGTVVDAGTASLYIQLGADFIVSPLLNPDVAKVCNRRLIPYIPGCCTPSEVGTAQELGCDVCKVFPASDPVFVKNMLAPMPWSNIMATGGISPANIAQWFAAGVMCFALLLISNGEGGKVGVLGAMVLLIPYWISDRERLGKIIINLGCWSAVYAGYQGYLTALKRQSETTVFPVNDQNFLNSFNPINPLPFVILAVILLATGLCPVRGGSV